MYTNGNDFFGNNTYLKAMYESLAMIRTIDWTLDDSEMEFEEYCLKTNKEISEEFGLTIT
jgi:hypothetical protein